MSGRGIGYGKTILFGEHFVVYALPAIASAISKKTIAEVKEAESGIKLIDNRPQVQGYKEKKKEEISRQFEALKKYFDLDENKTPMEIILSGDLECNSGVGASAALATSIARALDQHLSLGMSDEQINDAAYTAEKAGSGTPSGIDNTCSTYGGMIVFQKNPGTGPNKIEKLDVAGPLEIVMAGTGITQETKKVVADVRQDKEKNPEKYDSIFSEYRDVFDQAVAALKQGNKEKVGELMDRNQDLLARINVSCPEIEKICSVAKENGALGAKLTGTGRGGTVIALARDKEDQEKIAKAVESSGFRVKKTTIG